MLIKNIQRYDRIIRFVIINITSITTTYTQVNLFGKVLFLKKIKQRIYLGKYIPYIVTHLRMNFFFRELKLNSLICMQFIRRKLQYKHCSYAMNKKSIY